MKCCVSTDVGTWTNWLNFEPDPDYSLDAGTGLLSPISYECCNAEFYCVIRIGRPSLQWRVALKRFYSPRVIGTPLSEVHVLYRVHIWFFIDWCMVLSESVMVEALYLWWVACRFDCQPCTNCTCTCTQPCRQVVHRHTPPSPSSIIWHWPRGSHALQLGTRL